jgi:uncharacterized membrane protein YgdD (TMEM256/DUF423 family)
MQKMFLTLGTAAAAIGIILGAFGAHALKEKIAADQLPVFETGVRYQMYHAFALLLIGILYEKFGGSMLAMAGYSFIAGIIFFSGSLYLLSTRELLGIESAKLLGPITPLGGLCFISGWIMLLIGIIRK